MKNTFLLISGLLLLTAACSAPNILPKKSAEKKTATQTDVVSKANQSDNLLRSISVLRNDQDYIVEPQAIETKLPEPAVKKPILEKQKPTVKLDTTPTAESIIAAKLAQGNAQQQTQDLEIKKVPDARTSAENTAQSEQPSGTKEQQVVERKAIQIERSLPEKLESTTLRAIAEDLSVKNIVHKQLDGLLSELDAIEKAKKEAEAKAKAELEAQAKETAERIKKLKEAGVANLETDGEEPGDDAERLAALEAKLAKCGIAKSKKIDIVSEGTKLSPANIADIRFAEVMAKWNSQSVQILAKHILGQKVTKIKSLGIYNCRTVNRREASNLSQHAYGLAIDIAGFVLADGTHINLRENYDGTDKKRHFLKAIEKQACQYFSTNISPLDNARHDNHFHFDLKFKGDKQQYCSS